MKYTLSMWQNARYRDLRCAVHVEVVRYGSETKACYGGIDICLEHSYGTPRLYDYCNINKDHIVRKHVQDMRNTS